MPRVLGVTHLMAFDERSGLAPLSGAERHLLELIRGQLADGLDVELVMLVGDSGSMLQQTALELQERGARVFVLSGPRPSWVPIRRLARLLVVFPLIALLRSRRDRVIHTHLEFASVLGRAAAVMAGCSYLVDTAHSDEPKWSAQRWRAVLRLLAFVTPVQIAISEAVAHHLKVRVGLPESRVTVVRYGIAAPTTLAVAEARTRLGLTSGGLVVGFVGRLAPEKNVHVLLKAAARLPKVRFSVIGTGPLEDELRAAAFGATNVTFHGYRPDAADLIAGFDVFCLPSAWEGLGLVLLEAMHRGVPVVASAAGAIPEVLDECGVLVPPGDDLALASALSALLEDEPRRRALRDAGIARARHEFSLDRMVAQTSLAYARAVMGS